MTASATVDSSLLVLAVALGGCPGGSNVQVDDGSYRYDAGLILVDARPDGPGLSDQGPAGDAPRDVGALPRDSTPPPPDTGRVGAGEVGDPCLYYYHCKSGICAQNTHTGQMFCTVICDPCAAQPCPAGAGCQNAGPAFICAPGYPDAPCS